MQSTKKKDIRYSYDVLTSNIYDIRYKEEQKAKYNSIIDRISSCDEHLILDDGCGTGLFIEMIDGYIVGLDLSTELLSSALSRLKNRIHVYLIIADSDLKPFRSNIFHKIFSFTVLHNLPDPSVTVHEISRVSRLRSQIVITSLKKALSTEYLKKILEQSNFLNIEILEDENLKDWIAFASYE